MRTTVTFLICCFFSTFLLATHNRAGEIIYEQIAPLTIQATIITYTQTSSIAADRDSLTICWGDGTCETLLRSNGNGASIENDYKVNTYTGQHTYSDLGQYILSMTDPNRNGGILNVNSPNSNLVQFHLQTTFTLREILAGESNQSPTLLIAPIDVGFVRQPFMHTPNAIDLDGDSVAYELVTPLMDNNQAVPNYESLDQIGEGVDNNLTFNEQTGLLIWDSPQIVGQYNIAIKIKAYRDGELTEEVIRDMQILIKSEENTPPEIAFSNDEPAQLTIQAGKTLDLEFAIFDAEDNFNFNGVALLNVTGESIQNNATLDQEQKLSVLNGHFKWTPTNIAIRTRPYQIVFKATDSQGLATFKVFQVQVVDNSTSLPLTFPELGFQLFPNPATTQVQLRLPNNQINQTITISIFDNLGRLVQQKQIEKALSEEFLEIAHLQSGQYAVQIQTATAIASTLLVVH